MTYLRFITGVRPVDGTSHEVAKQTRQMEMQPVSTVESCSPGMKIGTSIVIYGTGQSTNGIQSEQVGSPFFFDTVIVLLGVSMLLTVVTPAL